VVKRGGECRRACVEYKCLLMDPLALTSEEHTDELFFKASQPTTHIPTKLSFQLVA